MLDMFVEHTTVPLHQEVISGKYTVVLYFLEKTSWGNKPQPAAALFRYFTWQNRSHYLVYPHG